MNLSNATYEFLVQAHSGFKGGLDKNYEDRTKVIQALEQEILKRRQKSVDLMIDIWEGEAVVKTEEVMSFAPVGRAVAPYHGTDVEGAIKHYGIRSAVNGKGDRITAYKPSRPKYPFVYTSARGTLWKESVEMAKARFGSI